jgi:hypothetical protein
MSTIAPGVLYSSFLLRRAPTPAFHDKTSPSSKTANAIKMAPPLPGGGNHSDDVTVCGFETIEDGVSMAFHSRVLVASQPWVPNALLLKTIIEDQGYYY